MAPSGTKQVLLRENSAFFFLWSYFQYFQIQHKQRSMWWLFRHLRFVLFASTMEFVTANDQCRTEVNIQGMALKKHVFKRWSLTAPHLCDVKCGQDIACQSYNYHRKYKICELNNRTKEARPDNFLPAPVWFYMRRSNGRGEKSKVFPSVWFLFLLNLLHPQPGSFSPGRAKNRKWM